MAMLMSMSMLPPATKQCVKCVSATPPCFLESGRVDFKSFGVTKPIAERYARSFVHRITVFAPQKAAAIEDGRWSSGCAA